MVRIHRVRSSVSRHTSRITYKLLAVSLFSILFLATAPRVATADTVVTFSVALQAWNVTSVPAGYRFGTGTFQGTANLDTLSMSFTVSLSGAQQNTGYIVKIHFFGANGGELTRAYGLLTTDSDGNGALTANSKIPAGTTSIQVDLFDKTSFSPPLLVLLSDPELGGDTAS